GLLELPAVQVFATVTERVLHALSCAGTESVEGNGDIAMNWSHGKSLDSTCVLVAGWLLQQ
ncbi:MAG: hypothetical protein ACTIBK_15320, partial [Glutamicibacter arilaitensis]|uniref:hypothetical protein n=1 Tax=Glutamicibacter arilaitensis TaxID=256701 RepID=UPI003F9204D0